MGKVVIILYRSFVVVIWPMSKDKSDQIMNRLSILTGVKYNYLAGGYDVTGDKDKLFDFIYEAAMEFPWVIVH